MLVIKAIRLHGEALNSWIHGKDFKVYLNCRVPALHVIVCWLVCHLLFSLSPLYIILLYSVLLLILQLGVNFKYISILIVWCNETFSYNKMLVIIEIRT